MRRCVEAEMRVCEDVERCISVDAWKRGCVNVRMSEFILYKVERAAIRLHSALSSCRRELIEVLTAIASATTGSQHASFITT